MFAEIRPDDSRCREVEWASLQLRGEVGDRIVIHADAGYSARPVINR